MERMLEIKTEGPNTQSNHKAPSPSSKNDSRSFLRENLVLAKMGYRAATELSPRVAWKAAYLYAYKGLKAVSAYKKSMRKGELYPPFMFVALTNTCNLRCHGCWVEKEGTAHFMSTDDLNGIIESGKKHNAYYYTLLGGEPYLHKGIWDVFKRHSDCYFQTITNGMLFTDDNVAQLKAAGNVTPLISLDGWKTNNDMRRGEGVFQAATDGLDRLKKAGLLFGIATTVTGKNMEECMSDDYVRYFIEKGAMYIWYYVYRPMGETPHPEYCVEKKQLIKLRKRLLQLRRRHPIFIIDTYWTATGEAFCPAAVGLGFHIGPQGSIEICPALSFAREKVSDNGGDVYKSINESSFLRGFQKFAKERTKGCVILEYPQQLHEYIGASGAKDFSGRNTAFAELNSITPRTSQHLPGEEIAEDFWFYRFLKSRVFFGMGAMG